MSNKEIVVVASTTTMVVIEDIFPLPPSRIPPITWIPPKLWHFFAKLETVFMTFGHK